MKKVILVDGNNLLFRSYYATAYNGNLMKNSHGFPTNAVYGFLNMINKVIQEEKPEYMMVAFDIGKTFRHLKYEMYKGGRSETPNELKQQFPIAKELCLSMGIKYIEVNNYEADDIIGTFASLIEKSSEYEGLIISSDKDLLQLISDKVKVKLLKTHDYIMMDKEEFYKTYGINPIRMVDLKALMGDSSDNIPGVRGIGEKTALNLLQTYHSLDGIYENIENIKGKVKEKLLDDRESAYLSYEIATICREVPLDDNLMTIKYQGIDLPKYKDILTKLEFYSLLKKLSEPVNMTSQIEYKIVNNLDEVVKEDGYSFYLEVLGYNYHTAQPLGVALKTSKNAYYIPFSLLKKTAFFNDGYHKYTYDLKKCLVVFHREEVLIDKENDDLMLEAYLLNKNVKNDIAYLANQYDYNIMFYDKEFGSEVTIKEKDIEIVSKESIKKSAFIYDFKETFIDELNNEEMYDLYKKMELPLTYVLAKMESNGIKVKMSYLDEMEIILKDKIKSLEEEIYILSGCVFNISSPKQLGDVLFRKMQIPYPKRIKDDSYSTNKDILDKLVDDYPIIEKILLYRTYTKLLSTYVISLRDEILADGKIHTIFNQCLTRTGRLSSERPNLQNIPIRLEEGRLIRKAFIPSDDSIIISSDYSQIELRVFAHMSKEKNLIDAFNNDLDIHAKTASDIFNVPITSVTKEMRRSAKAVNFGILYGISGFGLSEDLGIDLNDAKQFIEKYLTTFPGIKDYTNSLIEDAYRNGYVKTIFNRKRVIDELKNKNYIIRTSGERMALNTPIQGSAADILKLAMIEIDRQIDLHNMNTKMIVQVHDELVFDVPNNEVQEFVPILKNVMENIWQLSVPLKVDIEYGKTWFEAK